MFKKDYVSCLDGEWSLYIAENRLVSHPDLYTTKNELDSAGFLHIPAQVPGNFELDMQRAGLLDEPFYGHNIHKLRKLENRHLWYCRSFDADLGQAGEYKLVFEGVDTFADVYINGCLAGSTDNMLVEHVIDGKFLKNGENEIVVHISPVFLAAREHPVGAGVICHLGHNAESLNVRKAAHMYGWDIMPRAVSGGIWKHVYIARLPGERINEFYIYPSRVTEKKAELLLYYDVTGGDFINEYSLRVVGTCGDSKFEKTAQLYGANGRFGVSVTDPLLWWTRDLGDANLYDVSLELLHEGEVVYSCGCKVGIREIKLERTGVTDSEGSGEFLFYINGQKMFARGTNWVPLDAFHSRDEERLPKALELLYESGCNMVRCWGGNVYENDAFYDWCDEHGVAIWQDFGMGCATYPQGEYLARQIAAETEKVVKRLRQHACVALWAGDNECDTAMVSWSPISLDPNKNILTRKVIPWVLSQHDPVREYLPSSPYIDEECYKTGNEKLSPEYHLWGPRDYFKSDYYTGAPTHFASEIGYHGSPSPESIKQFITPENLWPWQHNTEWLTHATCMEPVEGAEYSYRIALMAGQIERLFDSVPQTLEQFCAMSQASQAEAVKFYIELFRSQKWRRTGIIWWNLIDGWPQFSDSVVDYYYRKKLAFGVIKQSQQPVCLMVRELKDNKLSLVGANETQNDLNVTYKVTDLSNGAAICSGEVLLAANAATPIIELPPQTDEMHFYLIEWEQDGKRFKNYYVSGKAPFSFDKYKKYMTAAGMWQTDGF